MKTFTKDYKIKMYEGSDYNYYFGSLKPCFFDIETTGLSFNQNRIILTALLIPTDTGMQITQFLAEDPFEEDRVLTATMEFFQNEKVDYLITYNGKSFDIPMMQKRLDMQGLPYDMGIYDLDLYSLLRRFSVLPDRIRSLSLKSVERFLGIGAQRNDIITGKESVELYNEYVLNGNHSIEDIILTHNREDVVQLCEVLALLGADNFQSILKVETFDEAIAGIGFPAAGADLQISPSISRSRLKLSGRQLRSPRAPINAVYFAPDESNMTAEFISKTQSFFAEMPLLKYNQSEYIDLCSFDFYTDNSDTPLLNTLEGFTKDYLIMTSDKQKKHREINSFSMLLANDIYSKFNDM